MADPPQGPHVSIAAGVVIGLVASFVQSLGLTVQRLSHISNERQPPEKRRPDWRRPVWLGGFAIFILSNVFGTLFQIGALPIVVLGPLGAVSLLWNALFARLILGDSFTVQLGVGSVLIAGGATLVGIFGVVPEQTHTLPELIALYRRPAFVTWVLSLALCLALVLLCAHLAEWRLARSVAAVLEPGEGQGVRGKGTRKRRWSLPVHHGHHRPPRSTPASLGPAPPARASTDEREPLLADLSSDDDGETGPAPDATVLRMGADEPRARRERGAGRGTERRGESVEAVLARAESTRVWIAVGYGATSGTLSGVCLLITKTGIDLLISTVRSRENQFGHVEAWVILATLLVCELFQLAYLNRALRLVGPTLVCPLSFCFYNCASIASGLIYYREIDALSPLQAWMLALGTAVLLGGVWVVSVKPCAKKGAGEAREAALWADEPLEMETEGDSCSSDDEPVTWRPRGFSIGLSPASPGFEIRPKPPHRAHSSMSHPSAASSGPNPGAGAGAAYPSPYAPVIDLGASTASLPAEGRAAQRPSRRRHGHGRSESLSGALYVGPEPLTAEASEAEEDEDGAKEQSRRGGSGGWWTRVRERLRGTT